MIIVKPNSKHAYQHLDVTCSLPLKSEITKEVDEDTRSVNIAKESLQTSYGQVKNIYSK